MIDFESMRMGLEVVPETITAHMLVGGIILLVVILILKGVALYKAARLKEKGWFWVLLVLNTSGILPLIYLYIRRKRTI